MQKTLFDKYGGFATWRNVISGFYDRILDSPSLQKYFVDINMQRLIDHQTKFVIYVAGGPAHYSDEHLERAHKSLNITKADFDEMTAIFRENLEDFDFEEKDIEYFVQQLFKRAHLIISG